MRKLPSGRFQVRYFHLGRRITGDTTFPAKGDARAFLAGVETDIRRGNFFDPTAGRITFKEFSGWWLEQRPIRPHTRETYTSQLTHLVPTFGAAQLSEITPVDVRRWHGQLFQSGLHPNSVSKICKTLRDEVMARRAELYKPSGERGRKWVSRPNRAQEILLANAEAGYVTAVAAYNLAVVHHVLGRDSEVRALVDLARSRPDEKALLWVVDGTGLVLQNTTARAATALLAGRAR